MILALLPAARRTAASTAVLALLLGLLAPTPVHAQVVPEDAAADTAATRTAQLRQARAQRAAHLAAQSYGFTERLTRFVEANRYGVSLPAFGLTYVRVALGGLPSGAGTTGGLKFVPFASRPGLDLSVAAVASLRRYWAASGLFGVSGRTAFGYAYGRYWHLPEQDFYGLGPDAREDDEVDYRLDQGLVGALGGVSVRRRVMVGAHASYLQNRVGPGRDEGRPNLAEVFDPAAVPGSDGDVDYAVVGVFAEWDGREQAYERGYGRRFAPTARGLRGLSLHARRGAYAAVEAQHHLPLRGAPFAFTRLDVDLQQFVPIRHAYQVLAFRQHVAATVTPEGDDVPFYLLPMLGGKRTVRGFDNYRFRDRHAVLVNVEYRWQIMRTLDLAVFADAGQVFSAVDELGLKEMETSIGIGGRFKSSRGNRVLGRADLSYSREGVTLFLSTGTFL